MRIGGKADRRSRLAKSFSRVYFLQAFYEIPTIIAIFTGIHWLYVPQVLPVFMLSLLTLGSALCVALMFPTLEQFFYHHPTYPSLRRKELLALASRGERSGGDD